MREQNQNSYYRQAPRPGSRSVGEPLGWRGHTTGADSAARTIVARARSRLAIIGLCFAAAFLIIIAQLAHLTVFTDSRKTESSASSTAVKGVRADIVDRNGELLATSLPVVSMYADGLHVIEPEQTIEKIAAILPDINKQDLLKDIREQKRFIWIRRALNPTQHAALHNLGLPGISFQQEMRRVYPHGTLFSHILGYLNIDGRGIAGLEKGIDERLLGDPNPVPLSLDLRLQHIMHRELENTIKEFSAIGGAGMIMDVNNGEILSFVSLPDFDPHNAGSADDNAIFNRVTLGIYEMGSTFKIFNTALALESGKVKLTDYFDVTKPLRYGRFTIRDFHPEKQPLDVTGIMVESSNIGSAKMLEKVGIDAQQPFLKKLGLLEQPPLELPERGSPMVPSPWRDLNAVTISFGHGLAVSGLQLVRAIAAVINGGTLLTPTLLKHEDNDVIIGEKVLSSKTSAIMRHLMRMVVTDGTAKGANADGYDVGGKTGTSEKLSGKKYSKDARMSSFAGAFPMRDPKYAIFIMVDEPKPTAKTFGYATGGWVAAPAVGRIIAQMAPILGIPPVPSPKDGTEVESNTVQPESDDTSAIIEESADATP